MGTKLEPGKFDCEKNAEPDEPKFTLLARDRHAPALVLAWASQRKSDIEMGIKPPEDLEMVEEALDCAKSMMAWRARRKGHLA